MEPKEEEIKELRKIIAETKGTEEEKMVSIITEGKQYSIRIPAAFVDAIDLDTKKDKFKFVLKTFPDKDPILEGKVVNG